MQRDTCAAIDDTVHSSLTISRACPSCLGIGMKWKPCSQSTCGSPLGPFQSSSPLGAPGAFLLRSSAHLASSNLPPGTVRSTYPFVSQNNNPPAIYLRASTATFGPRLLLFFIAPSSSVSIRL